MIDRWVELAPHDLATPSRRRAPAVAHRFDDSQTASVPAGGSDHRFHDRWGGIPSNPDPVDLEAVGIDARAPEAADQIEELVESAGAAGPGGEAVTNDVLADVVGATESEPTERIR